MNQRKKRELGAADVLGMDKSMSEFMQKWRNRSPEEKAASRKKSEDYLQAYLAADVWFHFYDPYKSVIGAEKPKFVDFDGKPRKFNQKEDADRLLSLAAHAAKEYLGPCRLTEDLWKKALRSAKQELKKMREALPLDKILFLNYLEEPIEKIELGDISGLDVARIYCQLLMRPEAPEDEKHICHQLLCLLCLREIDLALMSVIFNDAGNGMTSAINASEALASARALRPTELPDLEHGKQKFSVSTRAEISARALEIRNTKRHAAQDWAWDQWQRLGKSQYAGNKSEFARDFVIPKVRTLFETAARKPLEVGQKQVVEVWLKGARIGRNES